MCDKSINQIQPYYYAIVKCIWHIIILGYTVLIINIVSWVTLAKAQNVKKYFRMILENPLPFSEQSSIENIT